MMTTIMLPGELPALEDIASAPKTGPGETAPGHSAASRVFAITEMREAILLQDPISAIELLNLKRTAKIVRESIDASPSLQRKVFQRLFTVPANYQGNLTIALNNLFVPNNFDESCSMYGLRKVRVCMPNDTCHVFSLDWTEHTTKTEHTTETEHTTNTEHTTTTDTYAVLRIEIFKHKTRAKVLPAAFRDSFLCDTDFGIFAMLKTEDEGVEVNTMLYVPGSITFGQVLEAARRWAEGERSEVSGEDEDGMFAKEDLFE